MPVDVPAQARVGSTIAGKYRVLGVIGSGGMGSVFRAENAFTGRRVALKILRNELVSSPDLLRRFMQEAQSITRISHPNIVDVLDLVQDADGSVCMVQELLEGHDLRSRIKGGQRVPLREAVDLLVPIMGALVAAHEGHVIHRDIKPENIFLATSAHRLVPKLIDFGVSKISDGSVQTATTAGTMLGTPLYMSPEQVRSDRGIDARTDVWSLATVLYEMLAGAAPQDAPSMVAIFAKIVSDPAPRLESRCPELPGELAGVIHRALEIDRDRRWPTMQVFLESLLACPPFGDDPLERSLLRKHRRSIPHLAELVSEDFPDSMEVLVRGRASPELPTLQAPTPSGPSVASSRSPTRPPASATPSPAPRATPPAVRARSTRPAERRTHRSDADALAASPRLRLAHVVIMVALAVAAAAVVTQVTRREELADPRATPVPIDPTEPRTAPGPAPATSPAPQERPAPMRRAKPPRARR